MTKKELVLILPGLGNILQQEINTSILPNSLTKITNKASFQANSTNLTRLLFEQFAEINHQQTDLPLISLLGLSTPTLCATPCYLHADRDRLLLFANDLQITDAESNALIKELQPLFAEFKGRLIRHSSGQHLLQLAELPSLNLTAVAEVNGKSVTEYLPQGDDKMTWIRLWSEIQMQLFNAEFNQQRIADGKPAINGLWFWGMGEFKAKQNQWQRVQGENLLLKQLANATTVSFDEENSMRYKGRTLKVLEDLNFESDWQPQLEQWEKKFLKPALQQCQRAKINQLELIVPAYGQYKLTPLSSWRFW